MKTERTINNCCDCGAGGRKEEGVGRKEGVEKGEGWGGHLGDDVL